MYSHFNFLQGPASLMVSYISALSEISNTSKQVSQVSNVLLKETQSLKC